MSKVPTIVSSNWDRAYINGKYNEEGPIPFIKDIVIYLNKAGVASGTGFYPGCGNGRNLLPLIESGLDIQANDISKVAIEQLKNKVNSIKAQVGDFLSHSNSIKYDYLISLQLFQHVNEHGPQPLFDKVNQILKTGAIFILRVNSIHTQIVQDNSVIETSNYGGLTVQYKSGQKDGQYIHFYSAEEIHKFTMNNFDVVMPLREEFIPRNDGTYWAQWETILKKR